jgi:transitional endoplasmic reticulum ATPase
MPRWLIRDYHDDDLESVIRLYDATSVSQPSVFSLGECLEALRSGEPATVALAHGRLIGAAVATVAGDRAWVNRVAIDEQWRGQGLGSALLLALEEHALERRIRTLAYVLPEQEMLATALQNAGYRGRPTVAYFEKTISVDAGQAAILERLGGRVLPRDLWRRVAGMRVEKDLIEKRVIAPLAEPERAQRHGVTPPRAILLFGPPGTGKTTFARAIASRLGWPFVEIHPSVLATEPEGMAAALRSAFEQVSHLEHVLLFIDEVEEIAATRSTPPVLPGHGATNELLKLIPTFRQHDTRLLVCATNSVSALDPALRRPGRFDYIMPIAAPDDEARRALWLQRAPDGVDIERLVAASHGLTPAEIEYVLAAGAQESFERELADIGGGSGFEGPLIEDYLGALGRVRPTVSDEVLADFERDIELAARL